MNSSISLDNDYSFDFSPYEIGEKIGKGGFGEVFKVKHKDSGETFAAKI